MTYSNPGEHRPISFLVYLDGIETPAQAVSVSQAVWAFPTANIQFPPDRLLTRIGAEDRMRATVFYLDSWRSNVDKLRPQWRLMFDGEVTSFSYTNSPGGRSISLSCIDICSVMSQMKVMFLMSIANVLQKVTKLNPAEQAVGSHFEPTFPASLFFRGFDQSQGKEMKKPYDLVDNMLRAIFGDKDVSPAALAAVREQLPDVEAKDLKSVIAMHWFARWARKTNFHRRWIPMPVFEARFAAADRAPFPVLGAIQKEQSIGAISHTAGRVGDNGSVWDLLQAIFQQLYYEIGLISTPSAVLVDRESGEIVGPIDVDFKLPPLRTQVADAASVVATVSEDAQVSIDPAATNESTSPEPATASFQDRPEAAGQENRLTSYVTKPQLLFAVPPACNVLWHSTVKRHTYQENYRAQPTRMLISEGNLFNVLAAGDVDSNQMEYINLVNAVAYPNAAQRHLNRRLGRGETSGEANPLINPHNYLVWPEEFFKGPVHSNRSIPPWFMYLQFSEDKGVNNDQHADTRRAVRDSVVAHMNTMKVRRQLTPEQTVTFTKLRTRMSDIPSSTDATYTTEASIATAMDTIMAAIVRFGEIVEYDLKKTFNTLSVTLRGSIEPPIATQSTYRLYVKYEYYRERYGKRNGAAVSIFNPYIVPGYPCVLWDDDETQMHVCAYAVSVTSSLTLNSAETTVNYSFGRTFNEFFEQLTAETQGRKQVAGVDPVDTRESDRLAETAKLDAVLEEGGHEFVKHAEDVFAEVAGATDGEESIFDETSDAVLKRKFAEQITEDLKTDVDAVPPNPLYDIRIQFQRDEAAAEVYKKLFWQNQDTSEQGPVFRFKDMVQMAEQTYDGSEPVKINLRTDLDFSNKDVGFVPHKDFEAYAKNPDKALEFNSRPICTLDEWIAMQRRKGVPFEERITIPAEHPKEGKGAPYYVKILNLEPGPGPKPTETRFGNIDGPTAADTRRDWQKLLLRFRQKVYYDETHKIG